MGGNPGMRPPGQMPPQGMQPGGIPPNMQRPPNAGGAPVGNLFGDPLSGGKPQGR